MLFYILFLLLFTAHVQSQELKFFPSTPISCSTSRHCPPDWPCCSQFGECGVGPYCIGGCNPKFSTSSEHCLPQPALLPVRNLNLKRSVQENTPALLTNFRLMEQHKSITGKAPKDLQLNSQGLIHFSDFLISPRTETIKKMLLDYSFTYSGFLAAENLGSLTLGMPKKTSGSLISSTKSFLYGRSTVRMKTSRGNGVITAIVLISAVGDEIDFEFVGNDLFAVQSNYFHQGILDHTRMQKLPVNTNSFENFHTYEIDWTTERIQWIVDGVVSRTLYKVDTWNEEKKIFEYPQTPMRLQISLWPGGAGNALPGTISWAGGLVDWENSPDIKEKGQLYATVESISITPYENKFWYNIVDDFNRKGLSLSPENLIKVTYDYDNKTIDQHNWGENSVKFNDGPIPQLTTIKGHGLNTGVSDFSQSRKLDKKTYRFLEAKPKIRTGLIDLKHDFIQDSSKLVEDSNGNLYLTFNQKTTSNTGARSHGHNPLSIFRTYFPFLFA